MWPGLSALLASSGAPDGPFLPPGAPTFEGPPPEAHGLSASLLTPHEPTIQLPTQPLMAGRWYTGGAAGTEKRTGAQLGYYALLTQSDPANDEWHRVTSVGPGTRDKTLADTGLRGVDARPGLVWQANQTHAKGEVDATRGAGGPQTVDPGEMVGLEVDVYASGGAYLDTLSPQPAAGGGYLADDSYRVLLFDDQERHSGCFCPITKAVWIEPPEAYDPGTTFEATPTIRPYPSAPVDATADVLAALQTHGTVLHPPGDGIVWVSDAVFRPPAGSVYWMRDTFEGYEPFEHTTPSGVKVSVQLPTFARSSQLGILVTGPLDEPDKNTGYLQGINGADVPQSNGLGLPSQQGMEFHQGTINGPLPYLDWYRWRTDPGGASHTLHPAAVDDFVLRGCEVRWGFDDALKLGRQEQKGAPLVGQAVLVGDQPAATAAGFPMSAAAPEVAQVFHCATFPVEEGQNKIADPATGATPRWRLHVNDGPNDGRVIFAANAVNQDDSLAVLSWEDTPYTNRDDEDFPDDPGADLTRILGYLDTTFNTWYLVAGVDVGTTPTLDCRQVAVASNANPQIEGNLFSRSGRNGTTPGSHTGTMVFDRNAVIGNSVLGLGIGLAGAFAGDLNMAPQRNDIEAFGRVLGTGIVAVGELDSVMKGLPAQEEGMPYIGAEDSVLEDLVVIGGRDKGIKTNGDRLGPVTYRGGASIESQNAISWDHNLGGLIEDRVFADNVRDFSASPRCAGVTFRRNTRADWQQRRGYVSFAGREAVIHNNEGFHIEVAAPASGETVEVYDNVNCTYDLAAGVVFEGVVLSEPYVTGSAPT
ncbi:MAG: hypothetical protein AAFQ43_00215 [Bacteroidota bacterium]